MSDHVDRELPADLPPTLVDEARMLVLLGAAALTPADQNAMAVATALIQQWVDRLLVRATYTERHFGNRIGSLQLLEYPVEAITSLRSWSGLSDDSTTWTDLAGWRLVRPTGIVLGVWGCDVEAVYTGGYATMPADLEAAFLATFYNVRTAAGETTGLGVARRVSVTDVGSVEYDVSAGMVEPFGLLPAYAVALLGPYRAHAPMGVG